MVGVVIKGADSAIYGEDTCAPVQYTCCTLAHVHTTCTVHGTMLLTKLQYFHYVHLSFFGAVNSRKSNVILLEAERERSQCLLRVTKQLRERHHLYWYLPVQKTGTL